MGLTKIAEELREPFSLEKKNLHEKEKRRTYEILADINKLLNLKTYEQQIKWSHTNKTEMLRLEKAIMELKLSGFLLALYEVEKMLDKIKPFEIRQDLEQEGIEYVLIDKEEIRKEISSAREDKK